MADNETNASAHVVFCVLGDPAIAEDTAEAIQKAGAIGCTVISARRYEPGCSQVVRDEFGIAESASELFESHANEERILLAVVEGEEVLESVKSILNEEGRRHSDKSLPFSLSILPAAAVFFTPLTSK